MRLMPSLLMDAARLPATSSMCITWRVSTSDGGLKHLYPLVADTRALPPVQVQAAIEKHLRPKDVYSAPALYRTMDTPPLVGSHGRTQYTAKVDQIPCGIHRVQYSTQYSPESLCRKMASRSPTWIFGPVASGEH